MAAGLVGVVAYDSVRWLIVVVAGLEVNPFEAFPHFGELLIGASAPEQARWLAGAGFHVFNGIGFAVFYVLLLPRHGLRSGVAWALALEAVMLAVYPGWLDIRARNEFTIVSIAGHVAYGTGIGLTSSFLGQRALS